MSQDQENPTSEKDWIYRDSTKRLLMIVLLGLCGLSILLEVPLLFGEGRKAKFGMDGFFGFYAALGFISCTIMIFLAKGLGFVLKVRTNFYEGDANSDTEEESK